MKLSDPTVKKAVISRLKRIEGQVRGIETMVEEERDCREIIQQLTAVRSAVNGATLAFLQDYAANCITAMDETDPSERGRIVSEMITLLGKVP